MIELLLAELWFEQWQELLLNREGEGETAREVSYEVKDWDHGGVAARWWCRVSKTGMARWRRNPRLVVSAREQTCKNVKKPEKPKAFGEEFKQKQ